jgi:hypothetical protein
LTTAEERRRRLALTEFVRDAITRTGGVIRERDLIAELRDRLQPPYAEAGPFVRSLLESEPGWVPAGPGVWAGAEVSLAVVARVRESFRVALRAAGRPLHRDELLAAARAAGACPPALVLGCLKSDDRLSSRDGERYVLVEWEWLLPQTVDDYIYLALRAAGRPRHYLWITEYVNTLVPGGEEVTPREIHSTLLDRTERFRRVREGTYGLVEAPLPRAAAKADGPVGRSNEDSPAQGRSTAMTGTSPPPPTPIGATAERVGAAR